MVKKTVRMVIETCLSFLSSEYQTETYPDHWLFAAQVNYTKAKAFIPLSPGLSYSFRYPHRFYIKYGSFKSVFSRILTA